MATPERLRLLADFHQRTSVNDNNYVQELRKFMRDHRKEFDFGAEVDLEDNDEELVEANTDGEVQTKQQEQELGNDSGWCSVLYSKKCCICNNFEPRAHPQTRTFRSGSRVISFLEIQRLQALWDFAHTKTGKKCGYCDMIVRTVFGIFLSMESAKNIRLLEFSSLTLIEGQPALLTVELLLRSGWETRGIEIFRSPNEDLPELPMLGAVSSIPESSRSDQSMKFLRDCLDDCVNNHQKCRQSTHHLPKRILLFTPNDRSDTSFLVRLHIPHSSDRQPYAALSHCWGSKEDTTYILKAMKLNLDTLQTNIPWDQLSKTFQDGIIVAFKLGLQCIWIDSLCIVQDDLDDWAVEAAKMGEIYQNAHITIAAASSPSNRFSFLTNKLAYSHAVAIKFYGSRKASVPRRILGQIGIAKCRTLYARQTSRTASAETIMIAGWSNTKAFNFQIAGPLSRRAWTLQERVLSSRIVHFSDEGLVYECLQDACSEDGRLSLPSLPSRWEDFQPVASLLEKEAVKMRDKLQVFWRELLIEYTRRDITYRTDILAALSSIAARMHIFIGSSYLAGLWQDRFIEDLCWRPVVALGDKVPRLKPEDLQINLPTWSCFSIRHPIGFAVTDNPGIFVPHCALAQSDFVSGFTHPSFATVEDRKVVIEGRMREIEVVYPGQWKDAPAMSASLTGSAPLTCVIVQDAPWIEDIAMSTTGEQTKTIRRALEGETLEYIRAPCFCLDLGRWIPARRPYASAGVEQWFILVLAPSVEVAGAYERLGMIDSSTSYLKSKQEKTFGNVPVRQIILV